MKNKDDNKDRTVLPYSEVDFLSKTQASSDNGKADSQNDLVLECSFPDPWVHFNPDCTGLAT